MKEFLDEKYLSMKKMFFLNIFMKLVKIIVENMETIGKILFNIRQLKFLIDQRKKLEEYGGTGHEQVQVE